MWRLIPLTIPPVRPFFPNPVLERSLIPLIPFLLDAGAVCFQYSLMAESISFRALLRGFKAPRAVIFIQSSYAGMGMRLLSFDCDTEDMARFLRKYRCAKLSRLFETRLAICIGLW